MDSEGNSNPFEYQIFGLCFKQPGAISYFNEHLPPEMVGSPTGNLGINEFYLSLLDFHRRTGLDPVDHIAFKSWLESETELYASLGGEPVVITFLATVLEGELSTPESVTGVLRFRANKRKQLSSLQELQLLVTKKEFKTDEDNQRITYLTDQIRALENEIGYDPLASVVTASDMAESAWDIWDLPDFLPTQFLELNKALGYTEDGGFCKGAVHAVLAESGKGKSTFAKCLANFWADQGHTILYVNYEEAIAHWQRILLTQITGKNVYLGGTDEEKAHYTKIFQEKMHEWGDRFMVRHDPDTPYFDDLEHWLRDIIGHNERIPDVVIIDTIQSMFMKGGRAGQRWGQFEEMMVRFEKLAKDMHAVFVITAQQNSNMAKEKREVIHQGDAGGSVTIIQKSSVAIFLKEKHLAGGDETDDEYIMECQIPKNRITGGTFKKAPPLVLYNDSTKSYEPYDLEGAAPYEEYFPLDPDAFLT